MQHSYVLRAVCVAAILLIASSLQTLSAQSRRALIIGIGDYQHLTSLEGVPQRDADGFAGVFRDQLMFDDVEVLPDITQTEFVSEFGEFIDRIEEGDTVVFFFSGHGWSDGVENYLAFKDTLNTGTESSRKLRTVPLGGTVLELLRSRKPGAVVAFIDACRNNPFADHTKSLSKGLGLLQGGEGVIIAYAAGEGQTALARLPEETDAGYSLFTRHLLPRLANATRPVSFILEDVKQDVKRDAERVPHLQNPAFYTELPLKWCFGENCQVELSEERALWLDATEKVGTPEACTLYKDYIRRFPNGTYANAAQLYSALPPCVEQPSNRTFASSFQPEAQPGTSGKVKKLCESITATIYFNYDNANLNPDSVVTLSKLSDTVRLWETQHECRIANLIVEGHDDGTFLNDDGSLISPEMSLRVSERRAQSVADYLAADGMNADSIVINAFGATRPAVESGSAAFNRRVEVTAIY